MSADRLRTALLTVALLFAACATPGPPPAPLPPAPSTPSDGLDVLPVASARTEGGLRIVHLPPSGDAFAAALLFAAGPVDDPPHQPGLTGLAVELALLGTAGDPDRDHPPPVRAVELGARLTPVTTGAVTGWVVSGATRDVARLLGLLADVARRPSFPSLELAAHMERTREALEADGRSDIRRTLSVALGAAAGLGRSLGLAPDPRTLGALHREEVVRQFARVARADRGVLVLSGAPAGLRVPEALEGWRDAAPAEAPAPACPPPRRTAHVVVAPDPGERLLGLVTLAVPGPGDPERPALEAALAWAGAPTGGPIEALVGVERLAQARPELLDLGPGGTGGLSVLLMGAAGPALPVLHDLKKLVEWLEAPRAAEAGEAVDQGVRAWRGRRLAVREDPERALAAVATRVLYGAPDEVAPTGAQAAEALDRAARRRGVAVVGLGHPRLEDVLETLAPVTLWSDDGQVIGGARPPACRGGAR